MYPQRKKSKKHIRSFRLIPKMHGRIVTETSDYDDLVNNNTGDRSSSAVVTVSNATKSDVLEQYGQQFDPELETAVDLPDTLANRLSSFLTTTVKADKRKEF